MPFVLRQVEPVYLSRRPLPSCAGPDHLHTDERETIANLTLCGTLQQLSSLVHLAADIFGQLTQEALQIHSRATSLKLKILALEKLVENFNPRTVPVPESDLVTFSSQYKKHYYKSEHPEAPLSFTFDLGQQTLRNFKHLPDTTPPTLDLFAKSKRPPVIEALYKKATAGPITVARSPLPESETRVDADDWYRLAALGATLRRKKKHVLDIETRRPASVAHLREWLTDDEALEEVCATVTPDGHYNRTANVSSNGAVHRLPSPRERAQAAAMVFTASVVSVDVSGSGFNRMEQFRRSLVHVDYASRRRSHRDRKRKDKKRRTTIAGDDRKEIEDALEKADPLERSKEKGSLRASLREKLNLASLLKPAHIPLLRRALSRSAISSERTENSFEEFDTTLSHTETDTSSTPDLFTSKLRAAPNDTLRPRRLGTDNTFVPTTVEVDVHSPHTVDSRRDSLYEIIPLEREFGTLGTTRRIRCAKSVNIPGVKLRDTRTDDGTRSSSGNWSASSSTRASLDSQQNISPPPIRAALRSEKRSLSAHSLECDSALSDDLSHSQSVKTTTKESEFSESSGVNMVQSFTRDTVSEGTLTPEVAEHVLSDGDGETSSVYSCDAEGYYTSFHIDSGLKTSRSKEFLDNDYDLFGKGSTSTTASSAGTVILRDNETTQSQTPPTPPLRGSSTLDRRKRESIITVIHLESSTSESEHGDEEQSQGRADSGHDTASPPSEEAMGNSPRSQPNLPLRHGHMVMECSESETESGVHERLRLKTAVTASSIPAMCVVTPPPSDDESVLAAHAQKTRFQQQLKQQFVSTLWNSASTIPVDSCAKDHVDTGRTQIVQTSANTPVKEKTAKTSPCKTNSQVPTPAQLQTSVVSESASPVVAEPPSLESQIQAAFLQQANQTTWKYAPTLTVTPKTREGKKVDTSTVLAADNTLPKLSVEPVVIQASVVKGQVPREPEDVAISSRQSEKEKTEKLKSINSNGGLVSLPDLPRVISALIPPFSLGNKPVAPVAETESSYSSNSSASNSLERRLRKGARVTLDADGKVVYSSDSMRRRKGAHTTFEPGPHLRENIPPAPAAPHVINVGYTATQRDVAHSQSLARALSPPPYRPAPSPVNDVWQPQTSVQPALRATETQPGLRSPSAQSAFRSPPTQNHSGTPAVIVTNSSLVARSGSYRLANDAEMRVFQRNESYRLANTGFNVAAHLGLTQSEGVQNAHSLPRTPVNPNLTGKRSYGPRLLVNPRMVTKAVGKSPVLSAGKNNLSADERPSFYSSDASMSSSSITPPPRMASLPLVTQNAVTSPQAPAPRQAWQYQTLPARLQQNPAQRPWTPLVQDGSLGRKVRFSEDRNSQLRSSSVPPPTSQPDYRSYLPGQKTEVRTGRESPEEGGFLEVAKSNPRPSVKVSRQTPPAPPPRNTHAPPSAPSPCPSSSSCSLDVSIASSEHCSDILRTSNLLQSSFEWPQPETSVYGTAIPYTQIVRPSDPKLSSSSVESQWKWRLQKQVADTDTTASSLTPSPPSSPSPTSSLSSYALSSTSCSRATSPEKFSPAKRPVALKVVPLNPIHTPNSNKLADAGPYTQNIPGQRHSWSPMTSPLTPPSPYSQGYESSRSRPGSRSSWACNPAPVNSSNVLSPTKSTSITDFKKKLLQHGRNNERRMSAVEALKLSNVTKGNPNGQSSNSSSSPNVATSNLSRSPSFSPATTDVELESQIRRTARLSQIVNRLSNRRGYGSPRTDVMSSVIEEDKEEAEDQEMPVCARRQLQFKGADSNGHSWNAAVAEKRKSLPSPISDQFSTAAADQRSASGRSGSSSPMETAL